MADLVPDVSKLKSSLENEFAIQVHPMVNLQCAYEERCLASSARPNGYSRYVYVHVGPASVNT